MDGYFIGYGGSFAKYDTPYVWMEIVLELLYLLSTAVQINFKLLVLNLQSFTWPWPVYLRYILAKTPRLWNCSNKKEGNPTFGPSSFPHGHSPVFLLSLQTTKPRSYFPVFEEGCIKPASRQNRETFAALVQVLLGYFLTGEGGREKSCPAASQQLLQHVPYMPN